jgi:hypothetical protein
MIGNQIILWCAYFVKRVVGNLENRGIRLAASVFAGSSFVLAGAQSSAGLVTLTTLLKILLFDLLHEFRLPMDRV